MTFEEFLKLNFGIESNTTFWADFAIADRFGLNAVIDTFRRGFAYAKKDYKALTELCIVLNKRCWQHYESRHFELSKLYADLYHNCRDYAYSHLKGDAMKYFYDVIE